MNLRPEQTRCPISQLAQQRIRRIVAVPTCKPQHSHTLARTGSDALLEIPLLSAQLASLPKHLLRFSMGLSTR